jgi:hypothetical protein
MPSSDRLCSSTSGNLGSCLAAIRVLESKDIVIIQFNKGYETNYSAHGPVIICNRKQSHYSDRRICEMMT